MPCACSHRFPVPPLPLRGQSCAFGDRQVVQRGLEPTAALQLWDTVVENGGDSDEFKPLLSARVLEAPVVAGQENSIFFF